MYTQEERKLLAVAEKDIYFTFVYQVLIEDHPTEMNNSNRYVEITWCGHSFPDYVDVVARLKNPLDVKRHMDEHGGPMVLNYRFIKNFTKGVEDSWSVNALNQFFLMEPNFDH